MNMNMNMKMRKHEHENENACIQNLVPTSSWTFMDFRLNITFERAKCFYTNTIYIYRSCVSSHSDFLVERLINSEVDDFLWVDF